METKLPDYYKRVYEDYKVLVKVFPSDFAGTELIIHPDGKVERTEMVFDDEIYDDLAVDEFQKCSPMEFNLYLKGFG